MFTSVICLLVAFFGCSTRLQYAYCLRLVSLDMPTSVILGFPMWLNCSLDLETDELYSVKWYKNDVEFYRYLPRDRPASQKYDLPGIYVDLSRTVMGHVYLYKTDLMTDGTYRCEASAEAPSFQTVEGQKDVQIYELPKGGPTIKGSLPHYEEGDTVNVTCHSDASKPAAILKWFINDLEVPSEYLIEYPLKYLPNNLQISALGLAFEMENSHLYHGAIILRCTAIISQAYAMSSEELIIGAKASVTITQPAPGRDGPTISGGQNRYRVGDYLNVNCTSGRSRPAAMLEWWINEERAAENQLIRYPLERRLDGTDRVVLGLRFMVTKDHFDADYEMRLKCTATLSKVIDKQSEERVLGSNHQSSGLHVLANRDSVRYYGNSKSTHLTSAMVIIFLGSILTVL